MPIYLTRDREDSVGTFFFFFFFFTKTTLRAIASDQSHFISPLKNLLHRNLELKENRINAFREAQNIWRETSLLRYLFIYLLAIFMQAGPDKLQAGLNEASALTSK